MADTGKSLGISMDIGWRGGGGGATAATKQQKKTKGTAHKNTAAVPKTWAKSGGRPENKMADYCGLSVPIPENSCITALAVAFGILYQMPVET
jgi:hypothetical protein